MKTEIDIDLYAGLEHDGISQCLYLGDAGEPTFENLVTWEEIVEREIGYRISPSTETIPPPEMKNLEEIVAGLENAILMFKAKMEEFKPNKE